MLLRARAAAAALPLPRALSGGPISAILRSTRSVSCLPTASGCRAMTSAASPAPTALAEAVAKHPLTHELPGIPQLKPARNLPTPTVRVSTLSNGLRVATQETYSQVTCMALFADAGSMYESGDSIGACHFLETAAFKSTASRSAADLQAFTTERGIATGAVFNREVLMFKAECLRSEAESALGLLAEAVLAPALTNEEVDAARQVIAYQRDEALSQPQVLVSEHLYAAAYGKDSPLGRPEKCPDAAMASMTPAILRKFMETHVTAPRMVLCAVGIDHEAAVAAAEKYFAAAPTGSSSVAAGGAGAASKILRPKAPYVGGDVRSSPDWSSLPPTMAAATAKTEFTHMMLAFPTVGWADDDVVPVCVIDTLLGGGSSFSAGGPGKGMYSRLYREVLNAHAWVDAANAFSQQLYDSGIVGIYASSSPEEAAALAGIAAHQLRRLVETPVQPAELARARNQLASSVMMNLETRALLCEDIGRQILSHGKRMDPGELVRRIQATTADDISRVMHAALSKPPSFAFVGDQAAAGKDMPTYEQIKGFFAEAADKAGRAPIIPRMK